MRYTQTVKYLLSISNFRGNTMPNPAEHYVLVAMDTPTFLIRHYTDVTEES